MIIETTCPICGEIHYVTVEEEDFNAYKQGASAQSAFPYLQPEERELLISGICDDCWNKLFSE